MNKQRAINIEKRKEQKRQESLKMLRDMAHGVNEAIERLENDDYHVTDNPTGGWPQLAALLAEYETYQFLSSVDIASTPG